MKRFRMIRNDTRCQQTPLQRRRVVDDEDDVAVADRQRGQPTSVRLSKINMKHGYRERDVCVHIVRITSREGDGRKNGEAPTGTEQQLPKIRLNIRGDAERERASCYSKIMDVHASRLVFVRRVTNFLSLLSLCARPRLFSLFIYLCNSLQ